MYAVSVPASGVQTYRVPWHHRYCYVPLLVYAAMGTSSFVSVGPVALVSTTLHGMIAGVPDPATRLALASCLMFWGGVLSVAVSERDWNPARARARVRARARLRLRLSFGWRALGRGRLALLEPRARTPTQHPDPAPSPARVLPAAWCPHRANSCPNLPHQVGLLNWGKVVDVVPHDVL